MKHKNVLYFFTISILIFCHVHSAEQGSEASRESVEALRGTVMALQKSIGVLQETYKANPQESGGILNFVKASVTIGFFGYLGYQVYNSESMWSTPEDTAKSFERSDKHLVKEYQESKKLRDEKEKQLQNGLVAVETTLKKFGVTVQLAKKSSNNLNEIKSELKKMNFELDKQYTDYNFKTKERDLVFEKKIRGLGISIEEKSNNVNVISVNTEIKKLGNRREIVKNNIVNIIKQNGEGTNRQYGEISSEIQIAKHSLSNIKNQLYANSSNTKNLLETIENAYQQQKSENDLIEHVLNNAKPGEKFSIYYSQFEKPSIDYLPQDDTKLTIINNEPSSKSSPTIKIFGIPVQKSE